MTDLLKRSTDGNWSDSEDKIETPVLPAHRLLESSVDSPAFPIALFKSTGGIPSYEESLTPPPVSKAGSTRLVQRSNMISREESLNGTPTRAPSQKLSKPRRNHSDIDLNKSELNVNQLKEHYKNKKASEAEKLLVDNVIFMKNPSDQHSISVMIWRILWEWGGFSTDQGLRGRIVDECFNAVQHFASSRIMLQQWLSTTVSLLSLTEDFLQITKNTEERLCVTEFRDSMKDLAITVFEGLALLLEMKLTPVVELVYTQVLSGNSIGEKTPESLSLIFLQAFDFMDNLQRISDEISKQFFKRFVHFFTSSIISYCSSLGCSYYQALQIKMLITKIEDWTHNKFGPQYLSLAKEKLQPLREVANILSLPQKDELYQKDFRSAVCPLLRPTLIAKLLSSCRPDQFIIEPVPSKLIQDIEKQDPCTNSSHHDEEEVYYNPQYKRRLQIDFQMQKINIDSVELPKSIMDISAFAFMKNPKTISPTTAAW
eukprot:TRINITY_DN5901_c0_g1_i4.p1 TRINITY_DN5901_c0_g1~~TRINITY_DN5901_c0_g1_i4.p1  ORF type:complete len:485 (+),score=102.44 TRINITY_DN5901_c0_g1_i4:1205-2659(+)